MKFYVITDSHGETGGCEFTLKAAKDVADALFEPGDYSITGYEVPVTGESIRLLLAEEGAATRIWEPRIAKATGSAA